MNRRYPRLWLAMICLFYLVPAVLAVWHQWYGIPYTGLLQRAPLLRLPEFLAGVLGYAIFRKCRDGQLPALTSWQNRGLGCFIGLSFIAATWLFTRSGAPYWYFLLHNGLLLPAQVALVYLCAQAKEPDHTWIKTWSTRLGATSLSIFALHVPLFNLFRTGEQLVRGNPIECFTNWSQCISIAGQVQLSLVGYGIFLLSTILLCLLFQERVVIKLRQSLTARFLSPQAGPPSRAV